MRALAALLAALWIAGPAPASGHCERVTFDGAPFSVCRAEPGSDVRLFLDSEEGNLLGGFDAVDGALATEGKRLAAAMNGGMYHRDRSPVGLYVEEGEQRMRLITSDGPGNFGLLPNGVLCIKDGRFRVVESRAFAAEGPDCDHATQSGPMLVIDGDLHPRFLPGSSSRFLRNGVGIAPDGALLMAISDAPVNFHHFARLFRDGLGVRDALFLDGKVSRLHAPDLGRSDIGFPLGPILGIVEPAS